MKQISEEVMRERRLDRLEKREFYMMDARVPEQHRRMFSLGACHTLMTGFFSNSDWAVVWYCLQKAARNSQMQLQISLRLFYWRRVLRLTEQQIEARLDA